MTKIGEEYINHSPYKLGQFGDQLENMTAQEVFNIAVEHLLLQNKQSIDIDSKCLYNGDGVCCAAAPFIKDYNFEMERDNWDLISHTLDHKNIISELQDLHDNFEPDEWGGLLNDLAIKLGLERPQILIDKLNTLN